MATYQCLVNTDDQAFVVARPAGHVWGEKENQAPFEIINVENPTGTVVLECSFGNIEVDAELIENG